jgi:Glycosyltransferase family 87
MRATLAFGIALVALTTAAALTAHGPTHDAAALHRHLLLYIGAGAAWAAAVAWVPRRAAARGELAVIFAVAVAMRLAAWAQPPARSDDVYRYLWDGRVQRAGVNPYAYAPDDDALASLRDADWRLINNRELPTIYPPLAELAFAAVGGSLVAWKVVVAACDLGLLAALAWWLGRRGGDPRRALAWGWSPLAALELGGDAHMDALPIALLILALISADRGRRTWAGVLLGASAAAKWIGIAILPALRGRRAVIALAFTVAIAAAPYLGAGARLGGSLGEYGRRWRANDGAFALLHAAAERTLAHTRFAAPVDWPRAPRLARFVTGRDRDQIYPDEAAAFVARAAALALVLAALVFAFVARAPPPAFAEVAIAALLLLSPTLHPWYVLWIVPFAALHARPAWLALAALAPLGFWPLADFRAGHGWHDPLWTRALLHGAVWTLLAWEALTRRRRAVTSGSS